MQGQQEQLDNALIMLQQLTQAMARGRGKYNDYFLLLFWVGGGVEKCTPWSSICKASRNSSIMP